MSVVNVPAEIDGSNCRRSERESEALGMAGRSEADEDSKRSGGGNRCEQEGALRRRMVLVGEKGGEAQAAGWRVGSSHANDLVTGRRRPDDRGCCRPLAWGKRADADHQTRGFGIRPGDVLVSFPQGDRRRNVGELDDPDARPREPSGDELSCASGPADANAAFEESLLTAAADLPEQELPGVSINSSVVERSLHAMTFFSIGSTVLPGSRRRWIVESR